MIATKRTAALIAAAMSLLGAVTPAAFAQVGPLSNFNQNIELSNQVCPAIGIIGSSPSSACSTTQEQGNCQLNVGADRESSASGTLEGGDCS